MDLLYGLEQGLSRDELIDTLHPSTVSERRPVSELATIDGMLRNADSVFTARSLGLLVGGSRAITDFAYCSYVWDLAVDVAYQRLGIGRTLLRRTHEAAGLHTTLTLLAAPKAQTYYPPNRSRTIHHVGLFLAPSPVDQLVCKTHNLSLSGILANERIIIR